MAERALSELGAWFDRRYSQTGRPSIPPEQRLRALILQALYTIRSERQRMDQIDGKWRYRWFVGLKLDEPVWDVTVFTKNRERLLAGEVSQRFLERVVEQAREAGLLDDEHFTVDGSRIEAWASRSSFEKKKDPPQRSAGKEDVSGYPRIEERSGGADVSQEPMDAGPAQLFGTRGDGKQTRTDGAVVRDRSHQASGARSRAHDDE
jgi:transposase